MPLFGHNCATFPHSTCSSKSRRNRERDSLSTEIADDATLTPGTGQVLTKEQLIALSKSSDLRPVIKSYGADDETGSLNCTTCESLSLSCPESPPSKKSNDLKGNSIDTPSVDVPSGIAKSAIT